MQIETKYTDGHLVEADIFDQRDLQTIEDESPVITELKTRGHEMINGNFPNLVDDLFQSFYQYQPEVRQRIPEHLARNQMFLEEMMKSSDFAELRVSTRNDDFSSALAAINLTENLLEKFQNDEDLREQFKQQPPLPPEKRQSEDEGSEEGEGSGPSTNGTGSGEGQSEDADAEDVKAEIEGQQDSEVEMTEEEKALREAQARTIRNIIREAADKTNEELEQVEMFTVAYGTSSEDLKKMSFEERRAFIERIKSNKKLIELAQRVGRFQRMLKKAKLERSQHAKQEVVGVTRNNDVQRMTPTEHAMRKKANLDWKRRLTQRNIQTYKLEGMVPTGKGPVVICIDKSSSMRGTNDQWATAVMFAVMAEAAKDKRSVHVCFYNWGIQHTQTLIGGQYGIADLIRLTEFAPSGGTDFNAPLVYAYERIKEDKELRQADIVFITDGGARISQSVVEDLTKQRSKQSINMFTILIGMSADSHEAKDLISISDEVHEIDNLVNDTEKTATAFGRLANITRI